MIPSPDLPTAERVRAAVQLAHELDLFRVTSRPIYLPVETLLDALGLASDGPAVELLNDAVDALADADAIRGGRDEPSERIHRDASDEIARLDHERETAIAALVARTPA